VTYLQYCLRFPAEIYSARRRVESFIYYRPPARRRGVAVPVIWVVIDFVLDIQARRRGSAARRALGRTGVVDG
jgi:hypothetical protein